MKRILKCIAGLLVLSVIGLYSPRVSFCAGSGLFAKADQKPITQHEPKIMSEPEKDIPVVAAKATKRKKTPWLWIGLGAAALVGLAAIAAGSGGGGDPPSDDPDPDEEGTITVNW